MRSQSGLSYFPFMDHLEIFEPYDQLIKITICGDEREVPENNSILRGLQFLDMETISYGDFCWNGECLNCQVWLKTGDKEKAVISCRTDVEEGMEITKVTPGMEIS
jgi:predicted molibdopterin-dependent oxidoreductase YjgC